MVTEEIQKQKLKNRILTELYNSGIIHEKVAGICFRNHIAKHTDIASDILQETFYYLCKKSADEIISMYYDDGRKPEGSLKRLIGLAVTISVLKGVSVNKVDPAYPKHSLARYILFASNFQQLSSLSPTEHTDCEDGHAGVVLVDKSNEDDGSKTLWELIRGHLSPEETETLEYHLELKKGQGRYAKAVKERYTALLNRIEEIIVENRIHI